MSKPKEFWIFKGTSNFCSELELGDDYITMVRSRPDGFYDVISEADTIEGGIHVIEYYDPNCNCHACIARRMRG